MSDFNVSIDLQEARLQATIEFLGAGPGVPYMRLYGDTQPASVADAPGTPLICAVPLQNPCGEVVAGTLVLFVAGVVGQNVITGTATWARFINADGAAAFDASVTDTAGDGKVKLEFTLLYRGAETGIASAVFTD